MAERYNTKEQQAIKWHMDGTDSVVQLSTYPNVRFQLKSDKSIVTRNVHTLVSEYDSYVKARRKEEARLRKLEKLQHR